MQVYNRRRSGAPVKRLEIVIAVIAGALLGALLRAFINLT
jgi:hypothetical protein